MRSVVDGETLHWRLFRVDFHGDIRAVWPRGHDAVEDQSWQPEGMRLTWSDMVALSGTDAQIVDGEFVGFDEAGVPQLHLVMVDSSFWSVWSARPADCEGIREMFAQVVTVRHAAPESVIQ